MLGTSVKHILHPLWDSVDLDLVCPLLTLREARISASPHNYSLLNGDAHNQRILTNELSFPTDVHWTESILQISPESCLLLGPLSIRRNIRALSRHPPREQAAAESRLDPTHDKVCQGSSLTSGSQTNVDQTLRTLKASILSLCML